MQALGLASDAVENLTSTRRLDRTLGHGNNLVRAALKETATNSTFLTRSKRSRSLMTKTARRRILTLIAQGNAHTANGINDDALALTKLGKQLLHSSLLSSELLLIRTIKRRAPTTSLHDGTRRFGIHGFTSRLGRVPIRTPRASFEIFGSSLTSARTLTLCLALVRFTLRILGRLRFLRRFRLLRPLSRLDQSTPSLTLSTRFCHELTPLIYKLKAEIIVPNQAGRRYASGLFVSVISPTTFALRGRGAARN